MTPSAVDSSSAVAYSYDTENTLSTTGALLARWLNKATLKAKILLDGSFSTVSQFVSTLATGTKPIDVTSTTVCTNLNSDMVDGKHVGTSGNTIPLNDSANFFSATQKFGDGGSNYSQFEADGTLVAKGNATTYRDELGDISRLRTLGTGVSINDTEQTMDFTATANLSDYAWINFQINHDWESGSVIYPHIHWNQASNAIPNWLIRYRWQKNGSSKTTAWTDYKINGNSAFTYVSGTLNQISYDSGITPPAGYSLSDILQIRLFRDTGNASGVFTGTDPYTGTVSVMSLDCHIKTDTLGSRTEYTK